MQLLKAEPILQDLPKVSSPKNLAIIVVGENPASKIYVSLKQARAAEYGITTQIFHFNDDAHDGDLRNIVRQLNVDPTVHGFIIQLPLPEHSNIEMILDAITPHKDVDNLTNTNTFMSPVVQAVDALRTHYNVDFNGKKICLIGKGRLVGAPIARWLGTLDCTITTIDETTANKDDLIREADVIIAGSGAPKVVNDSNTRDGQVIFDCTGVDVDYPAVKKKCAAITPPKGGIGPLTVHFLLTNVLKTK